MGWYLKVLRDYATFSGRARRKEYWMFALINALIMIGLMAVDLVFGFYDAELGMGILSGIYVLAIIVPSIAVSVRRLHDVGRSGWWFLITFIPLIGQLVLLYWTVKDSQEGSNAYGANPKGFAEEL
ncbi:MAG: DUF805 domain-containing protein [Gemmatimonadota bacterium]